MATEDTELTNLAFSFMFTMDSRNVSVLTHSMGVLAESHDAMCALLMSNGHMISKANLRGNVFPMWTALSTHGKLCPFNFTHLKSFDAPCGNAMHLVFDFDGIGSVLNIRSLAAACSWQIETILWSPSIEVVISRPSSA